MAIKTGMRVRELTKRIGSRGRSGTVLAVRDGTIDVRWDDGHESSVSGACLVEEKKTKELKGALRS
jgi:hypothetical protein